MIILKYYHVKKICIYQIFRKYDCFLITRQYFLFHICRSIASQIHLTIYHNRLFLLVYYCQYYHIFLAIIDDEGWHLFRLYIADFCGKIIRQVYSINDISHRYFFDWFLLIFVELSPAKFLLWSIIITNNFVVVVLLPIFVVKSSDFFGY